VKLPGRSKLVSIDALNSYGKERLKALEKVNVVKGRCLHYKHSHSLQRKRKNYMKKNKNVQFNVVG